MQRWCCDVLFQSTPSARRATGTGRRIDDHWLVSIHALRTEGDHGGISDVPQVQRFNPRPPHGGRPRRPDIPWLLHRCFNPRPPHGGRPWPASSATRTRSFNPRPPHGGRRHYQHVLVKQRDVSIHALRTEGDRSPRPGPAKPARFNPRPPHGGRPPTVAHDARTARFNPRPPHGGRPEKYGSPTGVGLFQSTPSARRATSAQSCGRQRSRCFNPRPPHGGRRPSVTAPWLILVSFNPRPPHGGRLGDFCVGLRAGGVSIHALRTEGDGCAMLAVGMGLCFNPRPPHGGRHFRAVKWDEITKFQSTPSARRATR